MKVIIVGYGEMFRSLVLGVLNSKHEIVGVLRQDKVKKSKFKNFVYDYLKPSGDYVFIKSHALKEIEAESVNSDKFREAVKNLKADVVIVGSWSEKFSAQTLSTISSGFVNVHPSLLPKYRGPNPYLQVILHNEKLTGVTFHLMDVNYDSGSILHQKTVPIMPDDTGGSLKLRCCNTARLEIGFLLDNYKERVLSQRSQNEKDATYQSLVPLAFSVLNFEKDTQSRIDKKIRAVSPWLNCYIPIQNNFFFFDKHLLLPVKSDKKPGTIVDKTKNSISIVCKDFSIIKFTGLKIKHPFSNVVSKFFFDKIVKINDRVK